MQRYSSFLLLAFSVLLAPFAFAQAPQKQTLPNGLTVLVQENRAAPVVAVRFYVRTGSIYEGEYLGSGISHLFEHVLQEGTPTRTKEQINEETQAMGGQTNAYTSNDVTAYHIVTASRYFERALNNLADSMMNATFPEAEVKTQQGVIHHEMNMGEDDPNRVLWKTFYETAFLVHPVRLPVIGYRESFDRITREDIVNYYRTHYTPENTILSVAGDIKADEVFAAARKVLGDWERRTPTTPALPEEPIQNTPRRAVVERPFQTANLMMGWHTIPLQHPDLYALDVLARVLGGGDSSRLTQELRERRELVYGISSFSLTPNYDAGVFAVRATLAPDKLAETEKAVWSEINKMKSSGPSAAELARAQRSMESDFLFEEDVASQAERIAYDFMATGNPNYSSQYVARVNAVTAQQVQAMAKKYLVENGVTTAIVRPPVEPSDLPPVRIEQATVAPPQMFELSNGLRVILRENKTYPTVSIVAMGLAGMRLEDEDKAGVGYLTSELLTRGSEKRTAQQFSEIVDDLGGSLSTGSGFNAWTLSSNWLARDWRRGLSLVHEALTMPVFPESELNRQKNFMAAAIKSQQDDPDSVATLLLRRNFFGEHPYSRSPLGRLETVQQLSRADVVAHWNKVFDPKTTVLAIYGDVSSGEARRVVEYLFGNISSSPAPTDVTLPAATPPAEQKTVIERKEDIAQTVLYFGYPGVTIQDEDRHALTVLDGALSGIYYPGGRLHARLRDNQLVYGVHAFEQRGIEPGSFMIMAATTKERRDEVRGIIEEEVRKLREDGITSEELARAKGMAITANAVDLQTNAAQATNAVTDELFGLGYRSSDEYEERINAVTREDVQRVARKYLRPEASVVAIVEPA